MRKDCYAKYGCGHIEYDDTLMEVGERSTCSQCHAPSIIVARLIDTESVKAIIAFIRKQKAECEEAAAKYDALEGSHIPQATLQRKQYAVASQIELLQTILDKIGWI
jgi:hypothetical protein